MRASAIITTYKETKTLGEVMLRFAEQMPIGSEILVVAPDEETGLLVSEFAKKDGRFMWLKDDGKGKPAALNLAFSKAKGDVFVLTDGDVLIEKNAISTLLLPFSDSSVGAVSGRPISASPKDNILGFWSHLLTDAGAHMERTRRAGKNEFLACSGYLYALRRGIIAGIPENALADDGIISHMVWKARYKIKYAPDARVLVNYPTNFGDWLKQKRRSAGGYYQVKELTGEETTRSFSKEAFAGTSSALSYPKNAKEAIWMLALFAARIYLWLAIYHDRLKKKGFSETWTRVESTK